MLIPPPRARTILDWIEDRIDPDQLATMEQRHIRGLQWQSIDRPPVTISAPVAEPFRIYPYHEAFGDPAKMLVNELVGPGMVWGTGSPSIVNSVVLKDDFPLQIRCQLRYRHRCVAVRSRNPRGGRQHAVGPADRIGRAGSGSWLTGSRVWTPVSCRVPETMVYSRQARALSEVPAGHPDHADRPSGTVRHRRRGSGAATSSRRFRIDPSFSVICSTCWRIPTSGPAAPPVARASTESAGDDCIYLHFTICRGRCLVKDDSSTMLSPRTYARFIRPANERILEALGGGGIHWCGSGQHWRSEFVDTKGLTCLDWVTRSGSPWRPGSHSCGSFGYRSR